MCLRVAFGLCCLLASSCDGAGTDANEEGGGSPQHIAGSGASEPANDPPPENGSGQTGSIGSTPICTDSSCAGEARDIVARLRMPSRSVYTFEGASCVFAAFETVASGWTCNCVTNDGGSVFIGPDGVGCFVFGRAGACLWSDDEWNGCDAGVDDHCAASCEELEGRYAADANATVDAQVRYSECDAEEGACHFVLRIGDHCYANRSYLTGNAFDCAESDAAILAQYLSLQAP